MNDTLLTKKQAFIAMTNFLETFYKQTSSDDVGLLLGEMQFLGGGSTADPAAWSNWEDAIQEMFDSEKFLYESTQKEIDKIYDVLDKNPQDNKALTRLGILFLIRRERELSRVILQNAYQLDPKNVDTLFWLSFCLSRLFGMREQAKLLLEKALSIDSSRAECLSELARAQMHMGQQGEVCEPYLRKAIEQAPDWPYLYRDLITQLIRQGKLEEAEQIVKIALTLKQQPTPEDVVQNYYEGSITGRGQDNENYFKSFIPEIERMKKRKKL